MLHVSTQESHYQAFYLRIALICMNENWLFIYLFIYLDKCAEEDIEKDIWPNTEGKRWAETQNKWRIGKNN